MPFWLFTFTRLIIISLSCAVIFALQLRRDCTYVVGRRRPIISIQGLTYEMRCWIMIRVIDRNMRLINFRINDYHIINWCNLFDEFVCLIWSARYLWCQLYLLEHFYLHVLFAYPITALFQWSVLKFNLFVFARYYFHFVL